MAIDFQALLDDDQEVVTNPKKIFAALPGKSPEFGYLRDVQGQVLDIWYERRDERDLVIKMNVGSGKTCVGLLILQSSLAEGVGPAVYLVPDNYLVSQVVQEADLLGIATTTDVDDPRFASGEAILVVNVLKLVNGRSVFGVGRDGTKKRVGALVVDDAHACLDKVREQFRIALPAGHPLHAALLDLFGSDLKAQSASAFRRITNGDAKPSYLTVPFWAWQEKQEQVGELLFRYREDEGLRFKLDLIEEVLPHCRCVIDGRGLEIAPPCVPMDVVNAAAGARRRIYMTATLADDSVLVTDFGADPAALKAPIAPASAGDLGERMILMPQELDPEFSLADLKAMMQAFAKRRNAVVIVPSAEAAKQWKGVADAVLQGSAVEAGLRRLREGHVGLVVLVNRYDGIDLPDDACRVLALVDLPETESLVERVETTGLGEEGAGLRRQMQRIEQGMGRGIRSNGDHCLVILFGTRLVRRLLSNEGKALLGQASRAQLELSGKLAKQIKAGGRAAIEEAAQACLRRDKGWTAVHRKALADIGPNDVLRVDPVQLALREAFDLARERREPQAVKVLQKAAGAQDEPMVKGWLLAAAAEIANLYDKAEAQRLLGDARKFNRQVLQPVQGALYDRVTAAGASQAKRVKEFAGTQVSGAALRLHVRDIVERLVFSSDPRAVEGFESAVHDLGHLLGFVPQRPERDFRRGPDNLWALSDEAGFLVIECKSGATSDEIAKSDVDQLAGSVNWFGSQYGTSTGVPVIVHPVRVLDPTASPPEGLRVIEAQKLDKLKKAVEAFGTALASEEVRSDVKRIRALLDQHGFVPTAFIERYTRPFTRKRNAK